MSENTKIHRFEQAGLGVAPFACVSVVQKRYKASPDSPSQPGGMCDYCGTAIVDCCVIRDAHGKQFIVGNECVRHTHDSKLVDVVKQKLNEVKLCARHEAQRKARA